MNGMLRERVRMRAGIYQRLDLPEVRRAEVNHTSAMVALYPELAVAEALACADGEAPEELHLTLAFLGEAENVDAEALKRAVSGLAASRPLANGMISGIGRFSASEGEPDPYYASVDVPSLSWFREALVDALSLESVWPIMTHGFTPHITLAYLDQQEPTPPRITPIPIQFRSISVVLAGERIDYPLLIFNREGQIERATTVTRAVAPDAALDDWLERIAQALPERSEIDAATAQYRAGSLSLADLQAEVQRIIISWMGDDLENVDSSHRGLAFILKLGTATGALVAFSTLHGSYPVNIVSDAISTAIRAGAFETASAIEAIASAPWLDDWHTRVAAIQQQQADGVISNAQAASQLQRTTDNAIWRAYQAERANQAAAAGLDMVEWVLDPTAEHCSDCLQLAVGSPYTIDELDQSPGDGQTECSVGCRCDLRFYASSSEDASNGNDTSE